MKPFWVSMRSMISRMRVSRWSRWSSLKAISLSIALYSMLLLISIRRWRLVLMPSSISAISVSVSRLLGLKVLQFLEPGGVGGFQLFQGCLAGLELLREPLQLLGDLLDHLVYFLNIDEFT